MKPRPPMNDDSDTFFHGLRDLAYETGDEVVAAYAKYIQMRPLSMRGDLVLAMTRALVENRRTIAEAYTSLLQRCHSPAVITLEKFELDLNPGGINRIEVIRSRPEDIYFRDFLRSLWRRLTRHEQT